MPESYREGAPSISPENQEVLRQNEERQKFEAIFGKKEWRILTDVAEEMNIPEQWLTKEVTKNLAFQLELVDNLKKTENPDNIQKNIEEVLKRQMKIEKDKAVTEKDKAVTEKDKAVTENRQDINNGTEYKNEVMRADIAAVYDCIPGGKVELDKLLGKGKEGTLEQWTQEAKKERDDLKPEELEAYMLQKHKSEILSVLEKKGGVDIGALRQNLDALQIPERVSSTQEALKDAPISVRHREAIENGLIDTGKNHGVNVDVGAQRISLAEGGEVYQTYEYDKLPPVKYIENHGLRIRSGVDYEPRYAIETREQELLQEGVKLQREITGNSERIENIRERTIPNLQTKLQEMKDPKHVFSQEDVTFLIEAHETLPGSGSEFAKELANSPAKLADENFLREHIKTLTTQVDAFEAKQQLRQKIVQEELADVRREKETRVGTYQDQVRDADQVARDNLDTLVGFGFHHLGQGALEQVIALANASPSLSQQYPISLTEPFTEKNKRVLVETLSRLTGIPKNELLESDGLTLRKEIDEKRLISAFRQTGVMKEGILDPMKIQGALQEGVKKSGE